MKERSDIVFSHVVCLWVCLSGAFDHEEVELDSQFLVGKLMGTPEGAK